MALFGKVPCVCQESAIRALALGEANGRFVGERVTPTDGGRDWPWESSSCLGPLPVLGIQPAFGGPLVVRAPSAPLGEGKGS